MTPMPVCPPANTKKFSSSKRAENPSKNKSLDVQSTGREFTFKMRTEVLYDDKVTKRPHDRKITRSGE
jgi:hypothetical protein